MIQGDTTRGGHSNSACDNSDSIDRSKAFERAIEGQRVALAAYVGGNPGPFWATYSHADDVTVFGGFGGWNKGWHEFEQRTRWSSSQYHGGTGEPRLIASGHSGDLGYTVHLSTSTLRRARQRHWSTRPIA